MRRALLLPQVDPQLRPVAHHQRQPAGRLLARGLHRAVKVDQCLRVFAQPRQHKTEVQVHAGVGAKALGQRELQRTRPFQQRQRAAQVASVMVRDGGVEQGLHGAGHIAQLQEACACCSVGGERVVHLIGMVQHDGQRLLEHRALRQRAQALDVVLDGAHLTQRAVRVVAPQAHGGDVAPQLGTHQRFVGAAQGAQAFQCSGLGSDQVAAVQGRHCPFIAGAGAFDGRGGKAVQQRDGPC